MVKGHKGKVKIPITTQPRVTPITTPPGTTGGDVFDINSMPIVMGDQIIPATAAVPTSSTANASQPIKMLNKSAPPPATTVSTLKMYSSPKLMKSQMQQRFYQAAPKHTKTPTVPQESTRFVIVPSQTSSAQAHGTPSKYTAVRKTPVLKRPVVAQPGTTTKVQSVHCPETGGNKV